MSNITEETFAAYSGSDKTFTLHGKTLVVPANLDVYMHYRRQFRELAKACSDEAAAEYRESVHDLDTYMEQFPKIYEKHLRQVAEKAVDVLVSAGVYSFDVDSFVKAHMENFNLAAQDYQTMSESIRLTEERNTKIGQGMMNSVTSLFGNRGSFMQGLVDGMTESAVEDVRKVNAEQKTELFQIIDPSKQLNRVYLDYWNVGTTLMNILRGNEADIWQADGADASDMNAVLRNISNPNFPQEKVLDVLFDYILKAPGSSALFKAMDEKFGEDAREILDYFMYPDFNQLAFTSEDFPQQTAEAKAEEEKPSQDEAAEPQGKKRKKGMFSVWDKVVDGEKMKNGLKIGAGILAASVMLASSKSGNSSSHAKFTWGVKNGKALAALLPEFRLVGEHSLTEGMAVFAPIYKVLDKIPAVRNISNKIIVLER